MYSKWILYDDLEPNFRIDSLRDCEYTGIGTYAKPQTGKSGDPQSVGRRGGDVQETTRFRVPFTLRFLFRLTDHPTQLPLSRKPS